MKENKKRVSTKRATAQCKTLDGRQQRYRENGGR